MVIDMFVNVNIILEVYIQSMSSKKYEEIISMIADNMENQQEEHVTSVDLYVDDSSSNVRLSIHLELDIDIFKSLNKEAFPKYIHGLVSDYMQDIEVSGLTTYRVGVVEIFDHHNKNITATGLYADHLSFINGQWDGRGAVQLGSQPLDLSEYRVDELQEVARQLNISYYNKKKDELIDCIYQSML